MRNGYFMSALRTIVSPPFTRKLAENRRIL